MYDDAGLICTKPKILIKELYCILFYKTIYIEGVCWWWSLMWSLVPYTLFYFCFYPFDSSRQATAATRAAPRPEPSSDSMRSNEISGFTNSRILAIINE